MSTVASVNAMLVAVKSREVQRAMAAELQGDAYRAKKHFLAAAHLEQVLADDYEQANDPALSRRSLISAASCFWRARQHEEASTILEGLKQSDPSRIGEIEDVEHELAKQYPIICS